MGNLYAVRYWDETGMEHYEVFQQKKRFMDLINRLIRDGMYYEWIK